jgi:hypothetical protein
LVEAQTESSAEGALHAEESVVERDKPVVIAPGKVNETGAQPASSATNGPEQPSAAEAMPPLTTVFLPPDEIPVGAWEALHV